MREKAIKDKRKSRHRCAKIFFFKKTKFFMFYNCEIFTEFHRGIKSYQDLNVLIG